MIGSYSPGMFRVFNKKMYQSDWYNNGYAISGISYPGYFINLVHASLIRSTRVFASGSQMTANPGLSQPMILNSGFQEINSGSIFIASTGFQSLSSFFSNSGGNLLVGYYDMETVAPYADSFVSFYTNGSLPVYENNGANDVYCWLSIGFYLTPMA